MQHKVLVVEDDLDIAELVLVHLKELSLDVEHVIDGESAMAKLMQGYYDIVLLDIMLPGIDGLSVCREIKSLFPQVSVVLLTSKSSEIDRVIGLEIGADDYICKPFSYREFQARIKAQIRHIKLLNMQKQSSDTVTAQPSALMLGALQIDTSSHEVFIDNQIIDLTATEFDLIYFFARHPNQVFSRAQLLESVWGYDHSGYEHTVNSHINRLRSKLGHLCQQDIIETVWGVGYKLNAKSVQQASL
ncbi:response regulator transcription factor [Pseudoalteromonas xiamenensis]|uniref:response regulator transcription factor n=1 Tax=Pseudoalteromonas xiamenensis TaxID=882626 RepID=UPI0027E5546C|nr:response regulator transcription factor [Pseudoalteromonas xiamenensis]WMN60896.1 response regulator transcription factor [Pseudoalteromonas xiamenensis]